jgi:putative Mn2+ efflux pump MntP
MVDSPHLADTVDVTFVGRYILPIVVPVVVGGLGLLMLDECLNDDADDDDEVGRARALVAARGLSVIGLGLGISLDELVVGFTISFSKLAAGGVLAALAAVLLVGPPVVTRVLPHVLPHHKVGRYLAPPAVSTTEP